MEIRLSEHFSENYKDVIESVKNHEYTHYMFKGGRGSIKSSAISKLIPLLLMQNKDCHAVVVRKNWSTLKGSVYNQMIWSINSLGIAHLFDIYKSPLKLVFRPTGQEVIFWGCDDPTKAKGVTVQFGRIGIVWFNKMGHVKRF